MNRLFAILFALGLGTGTALVSWLLSFISIAQARKRGAIDQPSGGRKIHAYPIPFFGGLGIAAALCLSVWLAWAVGVLQGGLLSQQIAGFVVGVLILAIGGALDDMHPQPPHVQIVFPILASLVVIASGTGIVQITQPTGGALSLVWWKAGPVSLPSDIITFAWLIIATYSTKILDGLDGLVTGLTVIGASLVGALSLSIPFFQPAVGILSGIIGGAFLGFLPRNINPAKQFLGEAGSTIAGFSLGVLAILSSAKIAIALSVLAIPIADATFVVFGRVRRGVPWYRGDDTHLHFRLLRAGLSHRSVVFVLWGVSLLAGILALTLQTKGKLFLVSGLIVLAALASYVAGWKAKSRQPS
jgi:UDP-GlcNAc:undecaprenyl-phosphate GlcNAc-1-phosphate transferase